MLSKDKIDQNVKDILEIVSRSTFGDIKVYLVGGAIRDLILNNSSQIDENVDINDLDFVVFGIDYIKFAHIIARKLNSVAIPFKENMRIPLHGTKCNVAYKVVHGVVENEDFSNMHLDISAPRGADIYEDLQMRDFTINNLALDLNCDLKRSNGEQYAVVGDRVDLDNKIINPVKEDVFDIDPVRILRGFRQAISLNFKLGDLFLNIVATKVDLLADVAYERVQEELRKMSVCRYDSEDKVRYLRYIEKFGIWSRLFDLDTNSDNIIAISDKELLQGKIDDYYTYANSATGGSDTIYTRGDIHFSLFLSALFHSADSSELDDRLKLLLVSNKVRKLTTELSVTAKAIYNLEATHGDNLTPEGDQSCNSTKDNAMKQLVWRSYRTLPFVLYVSEKLYNIDIVTLKRYNDIMNSMDLLRSDLINGEDIVRVAAEIAPALKGGKWISELLEEVKIKLALLELRSKDEAVAFITDYLKSLS